MANIGATTAFYKVETSLSRANTEVSKSMERLATGKANANAGDRSSYVAMADTFRLDYVGTKAGIKGASVVMGYLETGMRVLDSASGLLARLQELAILGGNDTNSIADHEAINLEAEAIADEFNRLMQSATYKGKNIFVDTAGSEYVSMGGRDAEMTFGIGKIDYSTIYTPQADVEPRQEGLPNEGALFNLVAAPSDAVFGPTFNIGAEALVNEGSETLTAGKTYEIVQLDVEGAVAAAQAAYDAEGGNTEDNENALNDAIAAANLAKNAILDGSDLTTLEQVTVGSTFTVDAGANITIAQDIEVREIDASVLTRQIEVIQKKINGARVQAGSQYAALESAVQYTTDLTAQYELGYNTVNDVNFSMETAHLAKNQILQQAATAMLAQANEGQQGLLQLIQR
jgi:flagellin